MNHGDWTALWTLNVMGGSVATIKLALLLVQEYRSVLLGYRPLYPTDLDTFGLENCGKTHGLHESSETDENRLLAVLETQHGTFKEMSSGLQSFLLLPPIAGPQLLSLCHHSRLSLFYKQRGFLHSLHHLVLQPSTWET